MFQVLNCLTVEHDWRLVVLAGAVCLLASAVVISLFHRAQATQGRTRLVWLSPGCCRRRLWNLGDTLHRHARLRSRDRRGYNIGLTLLSLVLAALITGVGLSLALRNFGRWRTALGGAIVGGGVAAMHYTGMMALELPGLISWSVDLVAASIALGMVSERWHCLLRHGAMTGGVRLVRQSCCHSRSSPIISQPWVLC